MNSVTSRTQLVRASLLIFALGLGTAGGSALDASTAQGWGRQSENIVVHLGQSLNDVHTAEMALMIGENLASSGYAKVTLFLDREGVRIADQRVATESIIWSGESMAERYDGFVAAGGKVVVCPGCAGVAGITADDLRPGAELGTPETIAELLLRADKILDY